MAWQDAGGFGGTVECDRLLPYLVVSTNQAKRYNTDMKCALDFPSKKANLHLPLLNIFAGCAMLD